MLMTELWLVRHGQTDWNLANIVQGHSDIPLNKTGFSQAQALAERLLGTQFHAIYSSDLSRALTTARITAQKLNLPVRIEPRLREIRQGAWEGQAVSEILAQYPEEFKRKNDNPLLPSAPGAEPVAEVAVRMVQAANDILALHPSQRVLLFSHGFSIAALYCIAIQVSLRDAGRYIPENGDPLVITLQNPLEIPDFDLKT